MLIFALLAIYQLKHFLADYVFQTEYMLNKGKRGWAWVAPLFCHVSVHALFTSVIVSFVNPSLWWLAWVDFAVHFTMDRIKASPNFMGRWQPSNKLFWWALGFDQMIHHLTHYFIIWMLVS